MTANDLIDSIEAALIRIRDLDPGLLASLTAKLDALRRLTQQS